MRSANLRKIIGGSWHGPRCHGKKRLSRWGSPNAGGSRTGQRCRCEQSLVASRRVCGGGMPDVFLSYKREDAARVRKLVAALREAGLDVWWDEDIPPSAPWEATIESALADAKAVIVCWSPASAA